MNTLSAPQPVATPPLQPGPGAKPVSDLRIRVLPELLPDVLERDFTLEELGQPLNLSASTLRQRFKAVLGVTLHDYLKTLRLDKARQLFEQEFLTVKQVMARVGLNDVSHFVRDFRRVYGLSPSAYRDRHFQGGPVRAAFVRVGRKRV